MLKGKMRSKFFPTESHTELCPELYVCLPDTTYLCSGFALRVPSRPASASSISTSRASLPVFIPAKLSAASVLQTASQVQLEEPHNPLTHPSSQQGLQMSTGLV